MLCGLEGACARMKAVLALSRMHSSASVRVGPWRSQVHLIQISSDFHLLDQPRSNILLFTSTT